MQAVSDPLRPPAPEVRGFLSLLKVLSVCLLCECWVLNSEHTGTAFMALTSALPMKKKKTKTKNRAGEGQKDIVDIRNEMEQSGLGMTLERHPSFLSEDGGW